MQGFCKRLLVADAPTGLDVTEQDVHQISRDISDMVRRFNLREGLSLQDDWLPERFFDASLPETGASLSRDELQFMRREYYQLWGWDEQGRPASGTNSFG